MWMNDWAEIHGIPLSKLSQPWAKASEEIKIEQLFDKWIKTEHTFNRWIETRDVIIMFTLRFVNQ